MALTVGSLFAGIGGFDLGFERAGFEIRWQVEIDPFCRAVLAKHWPDVRRYEDVRHCTTVTRARLTMDDMAASGCGDAPSCPITYHGLEPVDVLCGGFPCQDISVAGAGAGIDGARSGLWSEFDRLIGELGPRYVVVENVAALLARGMGRVLGDLAARGFDAEWDCLPARAAGAPHQRDRVWIVAYPSDALRRPLGGIMAGGEGQSASEIRERRIREQFWPSDNDRLGACGEHVADAMRGGQPEPRCSPREAGHTALGREDVAHADDQRQSQPEGCERDERRRPFYSREDVANTDGAGQREQWRAFPTRTELASAECRRWWGAEPHVGRVAHGIPARVDRLRGLGNAIVPQIAEWIAHRIQDAEAARLA